MGNDGDSKAMVYIAVGALAAVGAGYLVWRYGMSEPARKRTAKALAEARGNATKAMRSMMGTAKETMSEAAGQAVDGAIHVRSAAMRKASEVSQRLRP